MNIVKNKALYFLSKREYSYSELLHKLKKYSEDLAEIQQILSELQQKGFLSEQRYVEAYINSKKNKYSINKIRYNLKAKVQDEDLVYKMIKESAVNEYESAKQLWEKKFKGEIARDKSALARQIRFLQNRGFSFDIINKILRMPIP